MAITIAWGTKIISVPQNYLTNVSGILYEMNVDQFRLDLKDLEDSETGMAYPDTHVHNTQVVLSGVTYARSFQIINGYTVTFEDTGSSYTVRLVGANHNIADVTNYNRVNLIVGNSAGLAVVSGSSGLTNDSIATAVVNKTIAGSPPGSLGEGMKHTLKKTEYIGLK